MKTKIEITSVSGQLLFEYEKEDNTVKDTLLKAIERDADLCHADLRGADLHNADLRGADLRGADLYNADLYNADLCNADLRGADLRGADLSNADLRGADLCNADLCNADLYGADLSNADLRGADLHNADLRGADLRGANLRGVDLCYANLCYANLCGAKDIPFVPTYLPEGEFIGWKKLPNDLIVKLKILSDSKRSRANGDKCRCDKALVLEFQNIDGTPSDEKEYVNHNYAECTYKVGEVVYADSWDDNRWNECSHGIHFFIDRQSAVDY
jgi:hypothetical protein